MMSESLTGSPFLERFQSLGEAYYRGADGLMLVADLSSDEETVIMGLDQWRNMFFVHGYDKSKYFPIVVAGNKRDLFPLIPRQTPLEPAILRWCARFGYPFFATRHD